MASGGQAEATTRAIVRDILAACATAGEAVDIHLAAFMVKAVVLRSSSAISHNIHLTKDDVQGIVQVRCCLVCVLYLHASALYLVLQVQQRLHEILYTCQMLV